MAEELKQESNERAMRKSVFDMQELTFTDPYPGDLPAELEPFHVDFARYGHCLMVIPRNYVDIALQEGNEIDDYEIQIPVKFVLEKGYKFLEGHLDYIVGEFDYDDELGRVDVPDNYYED